MYPIYYAARVKPHSFWDLLSAGCKFFLSLNVEKINVCPTDKKVSFVSCFPKGSELFMNFVPSYNFHGKIFIFMWAIMMQEHRLFRRI